METAALFYSPPLEEEECIPLLAWGKQTVQYVINHKADVIRFIHHLTKHMNNFNSSDTEDIFIDIIEYLHKAADYDTQKAIERSYNGTMVTLKGYVKICIKCVVKRYITAIHRRSKNLIKNIIIDDEGKEDELLNSIADEKSMMAYENVGYGVREFLKSIEHLRYKHGTDIFLVLYVRLLTIGMSDVQYRNILDVLGIPTKKLNELEKRVTTDEDMLQAIKAITLSDNDAATLSALEERVYSANSIKTAIKEMRNA